jgi:hypothetical protein
MDLAARPAIERPAATPARPLCGLFFLQDCRTAGEEPAALLKKRRGLFCFLRYVRDWAEVLKHFEPRVRVRPGPPDGAD